MLPIAYINLDADAVRRAHLEQQLRALGLCATRIPGVRWRDLPAAEQARLYSPALNARGYPRPLVDGEKGCYASHLRAVQHLLDSDAPALVVLEDDVTLDPSLPQVLNALAQLPHGWDVVKLHSRAKEQTLLQRALCPDHMLATYRRVPSMTTGYVVSRSGAHKWLATRQPFGRPVDVDLRYWWESGLRVCGVVPGVVALRQHAQASSIWQGSPGRDVGHHLKKWWLQIDYSLRNARHRSRLQLP